MKASTPVRASQTRTASTPAEAMSWPWGCQATQKTTTPWPLKSLCLLNSTLTWSVRASQTFTSPSLPDEAIRWLSSGLTETLRISSPCWVNVRVSWLCSSSRSGDPSQMRMVLSELAEARSRPSGLNATHAHLSLCPCRPSTSRPVVASQTRTILSSPPDARRRPLWLYATPSTLPVCKSSNVQRGSPVVESDTFTGPRKPTEASHLSSG